MVWPKHARPICRTAQLVPSSSCATLQLTNSSDLNTVATAAKTARRGTVDVLLLTTEHGNYSANKMQRRP
jgi:hypothetical protein